MEPGVKGAALARIAGVVGVSGGTGLGLGEERGEAEGEGCPGYGDGCVRGSEEGLGKVGLCLPTPFATGVLADVPAESSGSSESPVSTAESLSRAGLLPFLEGCWPICAGDCGRGRARREAIAESSVGASLTVEHKQSKAVVKYTPLVWLLFAYPS